MEFPKCLATGSRLSKSATNSHLYNRCLGCGLIIYPALKNCGVIKRRRKIGRRKKKGLVKRKKKVCPKKRKKQANLLVSTGQNNKSKTFAYAEVDPYMIFDALKNLRTWRSVATVAEIAAYMLDHFPVNPDAKELREEIELKMDFARVSGIVTVNSVGNKIGYQLTNLREGCTHLHHSHVTAFWKFYLEDTRRLRHLPRQPKEPLKQLTIQRKKPMQRQNMKDEGRSANSSEDHLLDLNKNKSESYIS